MTENEVIQRLKNRLKIEEQRYGKEFVKEYFDDIDFAISALKKIQQYREIGTVEECREAVEKQEPKKPEKSDSDFDYYKCPVCGEYICATDNINEHDYCLNCGQAIDWEESEE